MGLSEYQMFINGQWVDAQDGSRFDSLNPANGQPWASFPHAKEADVNAAVEAAQKAFENPNILMNCSQENLKESFQESNRNLEMVQKGLTEYLEKKRASFARFYFLSNDELLEILSQTKEVRKVRSHLRKVFEAIADLTFQKDDCMTHMISAEGEVIELSKKIDPKDRNVEFWMGDVEKQMCASIRDVVEYGITDYLERDRNEWITHHPGQIVLNSS